MISFSIYRNPVSNIVIPTNRILDYDMTLAGNVTGEELPLGAFEVVFIAEDDTQAGWIINGQSGRPVTVYYGDGNTARYYFSNAEIVGTRRVHLTAYSLAWLLDRSYHKGGIYSGETLGNLLRELVSSTGELFAIETDVGEDKVYGYLPYDTVRHNLQRLCVAYGFVLTDLVTAGTRIYLFTRLPVNNAYVSPPDRSEVYRPYKNNKPDRVSAVEVVEHTYMATELDGPEVVFDNTRGSKTANRDLVIFEHGPIHDLETDGNITIDESGVNYAIVSGTGRVIGRPYTHITRPLRVNTSGLSADERVVTVTDVGVITGTNSWNVTQRLLNYYNSATIAEREYVMVGQEYPMYSIGFPGIEKGTMESGIITDLKISPSTIRKASMKMLKDYTPGPFGNNFMSAYRTSQNGTWTVPDGVTRIRLLLVGGGQGGQGGYYGENGHGGSDLKTSYETAEDGDVTRYLVRGAMYYGREQKAAAGGKAGKPGLPGKVYVVDVDVTPGETLTIAPGSGGAGGSVNGGAGANGTATTVTGSFGTKSSEAGEILSTGYGDLLTDAVYALPGLPGMDGGDGGLSCEADRLGVFGAAGANSTQRISDNRTEMGLDGFSTGTAPATTVLPEGIFDALQYVGLVILPEGMEVVEDNAFRIVNTNSRVVLPSTIKRIGKGISTTGNTKKGIVYYKGTDWSSVDFDARNVMTIYKAANGVNPPQFAYGSISDTGRIGDDLTWSLDSHGILWISGTGELWDQQTRDEYYTAHPSENYELYDQFITAIVFGSVTGQRGGTGGAGAYYEAYVTRDMPNPTRHPEWQLYTWLCRAAAGGGGGGASNNAAGSAGGAASIIDNNGDVPVSPGLVPGEDLPGPYPVKATTTGGNGGNGANASKPATPTYGCGGGGGNGGGGGGNGGGAVAYLAERVKDSVVDETVVPGNGGSRGSGSAGGNGGNGLAAIYY